MTNISTKQVIQLSDPPGRRIEVHRNREVVIEYDPSMNKFSRSGPDLIISGPEEEGVVLHNFFIENENGALPEFRLEDGTIIAGEEFLKQEAPELDLHTVPGSGAGDYQDNPGDLLAGLDRLGSLGTTQWAINTTRPDPLITDVPANEPNDLPRYEPTYFPPMPPVEPPDIPTPMGPYAYQARAVLHSQDADGAALGDYFVDAAAIREAMARDAQSRAGGVWENAGIQADVEYLGGDGQDLLTFQTLPDGTIKFTLTQAALDYFSNTPDDNFIEVYYTVTVNGISYNMQVIVPNKGEFNSDEYCNYCKYEDHENSGLVFGEWHAGRAGEESGKMYDVVSSNMADVMTYEGALENVNIRTGSDAGGDWGADTVTVNCHIAALGGTDSAITAKGADSLIEINGDRAGKGVVVAQDGGTTTLDASGANSTIAIINDDVTGYGVHAQKGSDVIIKAEGSGGKITAGGSATAIKAEGQGAAAALTAETITITNASTGISADEQAKITVAADTLLIGDVNKGAVNNNSTMTLTADNITVNAENNGNAVGVEATASTGGTAETFITSNGRINITAVNTDDSINTTAMGISATNGSTTLSSKEGTVILAENVNGFTYGININRGNFNLEAEYLDVQAYSGSGNGSGITQSAGYSGPTNEMNITLNGADGNDKALTAIGSSTGMENRGMAGFLYVNNVGGKGDLLFKGGFDKDGAPWEKNGHLAFQAYGILGQDILVDANTANVQVESQGWVTSEGIRSSSNVTIDNAGELKVHSHLVGDGTTTSDVWRLNHCMGLSAGWQSHIDVKNTDYVNVLATSTGENQWTAAAGAKLAGFINVNVEAEEENAIRLEARAEYDAAGIYHDGDVSSTPTSDIRIGGDKTVTVDILATSTGVGDAYGITGYVFSSSGSMGDAATYVKGDTVTFDVKATGTGHAYMMAVEEGARNFINAGTIKATVYAETGDAHGVSVYNGNGIVIPGSNTVTGNNITLDITSEHGNAYGMYANNYQQGNHLGNPGSVNTVTAEGSLTLTITTKVGAGGQAFAMFNDYASSWSTSQEGYTNNIIGNSAAGASGADADNITLNGDIHSGYYGLNSIQTGSGADRVEINGSFSVGTNGRNTINTGDGDDVIILKGGVNAGSLELRAGDGHDTLVLRVDDETMFETYYKTWLSGMSYDQLKAMSIESIRVEGVTTPGLLDWLQDLIYDFNIANPANAIDFGINGGPYSLAIQEREAAPARMSATDEVSESNRQGPQDIQPEDGRIDPSQGLHIPLTPGFEPLGVLFKGYGEQKEVNENLFMREKSGMETHEADLTQQPKSGHTGHATANGTESSNAWGIHAASQTSNMPDKAYVGTNTESLSIVHPILKGEEIEMLLRSNLYNVKENSDKETILTASDQEESANTAITPQNTAASAATTAIMALLAKESYGKTVSDAVAGFQADDGLINPLPVAQPAMGTGDGNAWQCSALVDADDQGETLLLLGPSCSTDRTGYSPDLAIAGGALSLSINMEGGKGDLAYFFYAASSDFVVNRMQDIEADQELMLLHGRFGNGSVHVNATEQGDTLILQADTAADFKEFYNPWLENFFSEVNAKVAGVTSVHLEVSGQSDPVIIGSLEQMIDTLNAQADASENINFSISTVTSFFTSFIHLDPEFEDVLPHHVRTESYASEETDGQEVAVESLAFLPSFLMENQEELPVLHGKPDDNGTEEKTAKEWDALTALQGQSHVEAEGAALIAEAMENTRDAELPMDAVDLACPPIPDAYDMADLSHVVQAAFVA